jgi:hypothetical protein
MRTVTSVFNFVVFVLLFCSVTVLAACGSEEAGFDRQTSSADSSVASPVGTVSIPLFAELTIDASSPVGSSRAAATVEVETGMDAREASVFLETEGPVEVVGESRIDLGAMTEGESRKRSVEVRFTGRGDAVLYGGIEIVPRDSTYMQINEGGETLLSKDRLDLLVSPGKTYFAPTSYDARVDSLKDVYGIPDDDSSGAAAQSVSSQKQRAYKEALRRLSSGHGKTSVTIHDSAKKPLKQGRGP